MLNAYPASHGIEPCVVDVTELTLVAPLLVGQQELIGQVLIVGMRRPLVLDLTSFRRGHGLRQKNSGSLHRKKFCKTYTLC